MTDTRTCPRCGETKSSSAFNRASGTRSGYQSCCRACRVEQTRAWRARNRERVIEQRQREYRKNRVRILQAKREWRNTNPDKVRAHRAVHRAIARGELEPPGACERCGKGAALLHAHHADYQQLLEVEWLCSPCHGWLHKEERVAG